MIHMLKIVLKEKDYQPELDRKKQQKEKLMRQMDTLIEKLLEDIISDEIYQRTQKELEGKLNSIREEIKEIEQQKAKGSVLKERISHIEKTLQTGGAVEKATVAGMLEDVEKIWIYPEYMEIVFSLSKVMGMEDVDVPMQEYDSSMRIEYGNLFDYKKKKEEDRDAIVRMMQENPCITAKKIAEELQISLSGANYRLHVLKEEGKVKFNGRGGKGRWEILR